MAVVAMAAITLCVGCSGHGDKERPAAPGPDDVGDATLCPDRNAYCPVKGGGVSWPGRPAVSPSGRYRLEVMRADPVTDSEDWQFRVVDVTTGKVVLEPDHPKIDGGVGSVVAWAATRPDTVWTATGGPHRWRVGTDGQWEAGQPAADESIPEVVSDSMAAAAAAD